MSTTTRPELSTRNSWWISKHRYYELQHFCRQYAEWKQELQNRDGMPAESIERHEHFSTDISDPVFNTVALRDRLLARVEIVENAIQQASNQENWSIILLEAVTEGLSYDVLEARYGFMPISRGEWYAVYRRFFWILDKLRP